LPAFGRAKETRRRSPPRYARKCPRRATSPVVLEMGAYASTRDPRLFFIHSQWREEAAFDAHATLQFVEQMERLIDHPFDVSRTRAIA
jgi:quinol monooxygenase YgiN